MSVRALFVGGPHDGKIEHDHHPPETGVIPAVNYPLGQLTPETLEALTDTDQVVVETILYRGHRLTDLDGSTIIVYTPDDELIAGRRPDVTIWELAMDRARLRADLEEARARADEEEARAWDALRHADALAGRLRDCNDREILRRASGHA